MQEALQAGVISYLLKNVSCEELTEAIRGAMLWLLDAGCLRWPRLLIHASASQGPALGVQTSPRASVRCWGCWSKE